MYLLNLVTGMLSGEWLLKRYANGGAVVLARSIVTTAAIFVLAIGLKSRLEATATWAFDLTALREAALEDFAWLGAIFAASYAAYYSRFASQWNYLAGLYNQIIAIELQTLTAPADERRELLVIWWSAFIEDAQDVHLALKPAYAAIIAGLLADQMIRGMYLKATVDGEERLRQLESALKRKLGPSTFERLQRTPDPRRPVSP